MSLFKKHETRLDIAIDRTHDELEAHKIGTPERKAAAEELELLTKVRVEETKTHISKDTVLTVTVYTVLTIGIVGVELFGHSASMTKIMTSLAFRPKI